MKKIVTLAIICLMISVGTLAGLSSQVKSAAQPNGPDLTVEDIKKDPALHRVKALVHNIGDVDINGWFYTAFFLDDTSHCIGVDIHTGLGAGESEWACSNSFQCSSGWHTIIAITDYYDDIPETNEYNNDYSETMWFSVWWSNE
jgi:hypothetical protein